jgi:hypothetical protein
MCLGLLRGCQAFRDSDCVCPRVQLFLPRWAVLGSGMEYRVIWEIDIHADSPKQAVEAAREVQLRPDMPATVFEVWDGAKQKMHRLDLATATGKLENGEVASLRSAFRQLQCAPDLGAGVRDIFSVLLIFLDADGGYWRRR